MVQDREKLRERERERDRGVGENSKRVLNAKSRRRILKNTYFSLSVNRLDKIPI